MARLSLVLVAAIAGSALAQPAEAPKAIPAAPLAQPGEVAKPATNPSLYDESASARKQIAAALAKANLENRRVLVQWGFNKCFWCQLMHREFTKGKLAAKLRAEYDVVYVEADKNQANHKFALGYGAELEKHGYPYLTILDSSGEVVANQETGSLEVKGKDGESLAGDAAAHDEAKLLAFLTEHQAPYLQADAVLKDAMGQAKSANKKLFLHVGAPWCGWCHRLEDWLAEDEIAPVFGKDYMDLKIDQDRMIGGKDVGMRYGMPREVGIPWFVIIDPQTDKPLVDSMAGNETIGCPANDEEIQHFMGMLEKTRKNMTAADLETLKKSLVEHARKWRH